MARIINIVDPKSTAVDQISICNYSITVFWKSGSVSNYTAEDFDIAHWANYLATDGSIGQFVNMLKKQKLQKA